MKEKKKIVKVPNTVSSTVNEFYNTLNLAISDKLPRGKSEYKNLKIFTEGKDVPVWELIDKKIATQVTSWPEWAAIINQGQTSGKSNKGSKSFSRYDKVSSPKKIEVPQKFEVFNTRFRSTAKLIKQQALDYIKKAILYSLQRFENHSDYSNEILKLQKVISLDKVKQIEDALPLLDVLHPTQLASEINSMVVERIKDEIKAIENISYPYDGSKPCNWNLAITLKMQMHIRNAYRDKFSRLITAAEVRFNKLFCDEILAKEILPRIRSLFNNSSFLSKVKR